MKEFYQKTSEEVLKAMGTTEKGITSERAAALLEEHGKNVLAEGKKKSVLQVFLEQFCDLLVIILIIAAIAFAASAIVIHRPNMAINLPCLKIIASFKVSRINEATSLGAILVKNVKIGVINVFLPIQANNEVKKSKNGKSPRINQNAISAATPQKSCSIIFFIRVSIYFLILFHFEHVLITYQTLLL